MNTAARDEIWVLLPSEDSIDSEFTSFSHFEARIIVFPAHSTGLRKLQQKTRSLGPVG